MEIDVSWNEGGEEIGVLMDFMDLEEGGEDWFGEVRVVLVRREKKEKKRRELCEKGEGVCGNKGGNGYVCASNW